MPIYAYRCGACGHSKDVLQKLSDPVLSQCPACGAEAFSKQLTAAGFQLKGSGWYVTDFKGGNQPPAKKDDAAAEAGDKAADTPGDKGAEKPSADTPAVPAAAVAGDKGAAAPTPTPAPAPTSSPAPSASPPSGA